MREVIEKVARGPDDAAFMLAMIVVRDRVQSLPAADREDLYELSKIVMTDESQDEVDSALVAIYEIMEKQPACGVTQMPLSDEPSADLKGWLEFVSQKIRDARKKAGLTQIELAEAAGLPQSHISRLENAMHSPSQATLEKIAEATGRPVSDFDPSA